MFRRTIRFGNPVMLMGVATILATAGAWLPAAAQEEQAKPAGRPRIEIEPKSLNLGPVFVGDKGKGEVVIRNTGTAPLDITRAQSSCGCTAAFLSDRDRRIEPGGSSVLPITMAPKAAARGTVFAKTVTIFSNDPIQPALPIRVECTVMLGVDVSPAAVTLRQMQYAEVRTAELKLTSQTDEPFRITSIQEVPGPVLFEYDAEREALEHTVKVTVGPLARPDKIHARIVILTSHSKTPRIETALLVEPERLVEVVPNYLSLGRHDPGEIVEKQVTIRAAGDRKLETIEARVERFSIDVAVRKLEGDEPDQWVLEFKVPRDLAGRKLISPLILNTNIKEAGPVKINMSLTINSPTEPETSRSEQASG